MDIRDYLISTRNNLKNKLLNNTTKIFFCHVPKCAGTSLAKAITRQVYPGYQQLFIPNFRLDLDAGKTTAEIYSLAKVDVRQTVVAYSLATGKYKYGHGHVYCRPDMVKALSDQWNFITILRNPIDRWISEYTYNTYKTHKWAKNNLSIDEYLKSEKGKGTGESFLRYFSNIPYPFNGNPQQYIDEAVENLNSFSVVGAIEYFDEWCDRFEKVFSKKLIVEKTNKSPKSEISNQIRNDSQLMKKITSLCESDMQIYQRIVQK